MITLYAAMLVTLGFLIAALIIVVLLPAYRRRIERFATEALKRTLPLTEEEIRADKDRLRAEFAMDLHKLETKVEEASLASARQSVELNRRDAKIQELTEAIDNHKMSVGEHENARRVLEQAILDRLPKVEQRLTETRKLLAARDREIRELLATSAKQANALDEASQLNTQREKELVKLRTTLNTRAARNRNARADERDDGNVALRSELEALRAQSRQQADQITKLQFEARKASVTIPAGESVTAEIKKLTAALAKSEGELSKMKASVGGDDAARIALEDRLADLQAASDAKSSEIAKLKAAVKSYEEKAPQPGSISQQADLSALQTEVDEQRNTIAALKAEIASSQERLSRQAVHFHEELRRITPRTHAEAESSESEAPRKPLAERIAEPRPVRPPPLDVVAASDDKARDTRPGSFLRSLNGTAANGNDSSDGPEGQQPPPLPMTESPPKVPPAIPAAARQPRLLERISGLNKR